MKRLPAVEVQPELIPQNSSPDPLPNAPPNRALRSRKLIAANLLVFVGFMYLYFNVQTTFTKVNLSSQNPFLLVESTTKSFEFQTQMNISNSSKNSENLDNSTLNRTQDALTQNKTKEASDSSELTNKTKEEISKNATDYRNSTLNETQEPSAPNKTEESSSSVNTTTPIEEEKTISNHSEKTNATKAEESLTFLETKDYSNQLNYDSFGEKMRYRPDKFTKEMPSDREGSSAFLTEGGIVDQKEARFRILCCLQQSQHCYSKTIAEHIDLVWAFSPIYTLFPERMPEIYITHMNYIGYLKSFGIQTILLEAIYPDQDFKVTTAGNEPWEIQLIVEDYLYYRENFVNVAVRKTKHLNYDYIIWLDSHQVFLNPYWWEDGIYKMARYPTVSFFHDLVHVKYAGNNQTMREGTDQPGVQYVYQHTSDMNYWLSGYGRWAAWNGNAVGVRREIYDKIEYIVDYCVVGCCDCIFNDATMTSYWDLMDSFGSYGKAMQPWITAARKVLGGENGVVRGRLLHLYHEHIRYDGVATKTLVHYPNLNLWNEVYRDENFTLHIKPGSFLKRIITKPPDNIPMY